jgi:glucose/arabinose dehydrogenase
MLCLFSGYAKDAPPTADELKQNFIAEHDWPALSFQPGRPTAAQNRANRHQPPIDLGLRTSRGVWGRPAALTVAKDGALLIADDTGGTDLARAICG